MLLLFFCLFVLPLAVTKL
uniref:Uncharacterized protein n=1 Tax=Anguilla anguilla TaxID=7936 RepID=A0A0E9W6C4_ANGAN